MPHYDKRGCRLVQVDKMITNQPNHIFSAGREAMFACLESKFTFSEHGNLFGAAIPISLNGRTKQTFATR